MTPTLVALDIPRYLKDRAAFRREQCVLPSGRLYGDVEEPWQRSNLWGPYDEREPDGTPLRKLMYLEMARGMAKSTMAALAVLEFALFEPHGEAFLFASDADQAGICRKILAGLIRSNRALASSFTVGQSKIEVPATGSTVTVMSSDAGSAFGIGGAARALLVVCDELWTWRDAELWEAIVSSTGKVAGNWRVLALSNAGIKGVSTVAWKVREACRKSEDNALYFWASPGCIAGWISEAWKVQQSKLLTPQSYKRLIDNQWSEAESGFCSPAEWDACISPDVAPWPDEVPGTVVVGVDASVGARTGADTTAAVAVASEGPFQRLIAHRTWEPTAGGIDLRTTLLPFLIDLKKRYRIRILADPYNLSTLSQIAREHGLSIEEVAQSPANQTRFTSTLRDAIRSRSLRVYADSADLRGHVLNAVITEGQRGHRLSKPKASSKIDACIALALAVDGLAGGRVLGDIDSVLRFMDLSPRAIAARDKAREEKRSGQQPAPPPAHICPESEGEVMLACDGDQGHHLVHIDGGKHGRREWTWGGYGQETWVPEHIAEILLAAYPAKFRVVQRSN